MIQYLYMTNRFQQFLSSFSQILVDFEKALIDNDIVLIGDLAEYEIAPRLQSIALLSAD